MVGFGTDVVVFCFVGGGVASLTDHCRKGLWWRVAVVLFALVEGLSGLFGAGCLGGRHWPRSRKHGL